MPSRFCIKCSGTTISSFFNILLKLKFNNISIINYETVIEKFEDELNLLNSFENKNTAERYFTLTPFFISYVFNSVESNTKLIYLDADIYLYNNIIEELNTMKNYDVLLIPHLYEEEDKFKYFKYGIYNVGLISIKVNLNGSKIIDWWKASCVNWCYDRIESNRYADQKYLDFIPIIFENIKEITIPGFNVAPWNTKYRKLSYLNNNYFINKNHKLYFFHFHGLKNYSHIWVTNFFIYQQSIKTNGYLNLYKDYINLLYKIDSNYNLLQNSKLLKISKVRFSIMKLIYRLIFNIITFNVLVK